MQLSRHLIILFWLLLVGLVLAVPAYAEQNINPGINQSYQDPDYDRARGMFERAGREVYDRRHDIVVALELQAGMRVADIGAGSGFFSLMFAERVKAQGKVYAVDIAENFVRHIELRAREAGFNNVIGIVSTQQDTRLEPGSIDLAFVSDTYHHFEYPHTLLASLHRALRPGGRLVIIDFRREPGFSSPWVMSHVRADQHTVTREVTEAGFELVRERDLLRINYFLEFVRP